MVDTRFHEIGNYPHVDLDDNEIEPLQEILSRYQSFVPGFLLPSRDSLNLYLNAYFESFHPHLPFIHPSTFNPSTSNLELVLSIAAAGAQYRFEHQQSKTLFFAAIDIRHARMRERRGAPGRSRSSISTNEDSEPSGLDQNTHYQESTDVVGTDNRHDIQSGPEASLMDDARCLLNLIVFSTWRFDRHIHDTALALQSSLVQCVREAGLDDSDSDINNGQLEWQAWAGKESDKRTKLLAFAFLNIQSLAYDIPPILRAEELNVGLPSSSEEWAATTSEHWRALRNDRHHTARGRFADTLTYLVNSDGVANIEPPPSALGNYVLLHGLLQRIFLLRQGTIRGDGKNAMSDEDVNCLEYVDVDSQS